MMRSLAALQRMQFNFFVTPRDLTALLLPDFARFIGPCASGVAHRSGQCSAFSEAINHTRMSERI
jgi:hypothetical protein